MENNSLKKIINFLPFIFILATISLLVYGLYYISKLENQILERDKIIQNLSFRSDLIDEYFDVEVDSTQNTTSYTLKDSKKTTIIEKIINQKTISIEKNNEELVSDYIKLVNEYNLISVENAKNKTLIDEQRAVLELIEKNYHIKYKVSIDSIYTRTTLINTEKIDSALLLLPYYRDKLKKVDEKTWTISVQR